MAWFRSLLFKLSRLLTELSLLGMEIDYAEMLCTAPAIESQHPSLYLFDDLESLKHSKACNGGIRHVDPLLETPFPPRNAAKKRLEISSEFERKLRADSITGAAQSNRVVRTRPSLQTKVSTRATSATPEAYFVYDDPLDNAYDGDRVLGRGGQAHVYLYKKKPASRVAALLDSSSTSSSSQSRSKPTVPLFRIYNHASLPQFLAVKVITCAGPGAGSATAKYYVRAKHIATLIRRHGGHRAIMDAFYDRASDHFWDSEPDGVHSYRAIMPYANAGDLHSFTELYCMRDASLEIPEPFIWHVFREMAGALAFLHGLPPRPICHRDVKPSNIVLNRDVSLAQWGAYAYPSLQLMDFDLAKEYDPEDCFFWGGTSTFQPPEQLHSREPCATPAGDVYALGGVVKFLATGQSPRTYTAGEEAVDRQYARGSGGDGEEGPRSPLIHLDEGYSGMLDYWMNAAMDPDVGVRVSAKELCQLMVPDYADVKLREWEALSVEDKRLPIEPEVKTVGQRKDWGSDDAMSEGRGWEDAVSRGALFERREDDRSAEDSWEENKILAVEPLPDRLLTVELDSRLGSGWMDVAQDIENGRGRIAYLRTEEFKR